MAYNFCHPISVNQYKLGRMGTEPAAQYHPPKAFIGIGAAAFVIGTVMFLYPVIGIASVVLIFGGFFVVAFSTVKVIRHLVKEHIGPSCFTEWLGLVVICTGTFLLLALSAYMAIVGIATGTIATFSRNTGSVVRDDYPIYFWFSVIGWLSTCGFCARGLWRLRCIAFPNPAFQRALREKSAPQS